MLSVSKRRTNGLRNDLDPYRILQSSFVVFLITLGCCGVILNFSSVLGGGSTTTTTKKATIHHHHHHEVDDTFYYGAEVEGNNDEYVRNETKEPKLIIHIGPLKTGTTTIQNVLYGNPKIKKILHEKDNYLILANDRRKTQDFFDKCLYQQDQYQCYKFKSYFRQQLNDLMDTIDQWNDDNQMDDTQVVHSLELWSKIPRTEFAFKIMRDLFSRWDVHFVIYYRPFLDWLPSMYKQYRKFTVLDSTYDFEEKYNMNQKIPSFPEYLNRTMMVIGREQSTPEMESMTLYSKDDIFHDIYHVYLVYHDYLKYINKDGNPQDKIHVMQAYTSDNTNTKIEFICNLLEAKETCSEVQTMDNSDKSNESDFYASFLDLDLLVREAKKQGLIDHMPRHQAAVLLQRKIEESDDLQMSDFPFHCPSKEQEEWIWNRTVTSEEKFGIGTDTGASSNDSNQTRVSIIKKLRRQFDDAIMERKFCSMDAATALMNEKIKRLFQNWRK